MTRQVIKYVYDIACPSKTSTIEINPYTRLFLCYDVMKQQYFPLTQDYRRKMENINENIQKQQIFIC